MSEMQLEANAMSKRLRTTRGLGYGRPTDPLRIACLALTALATVLGLATTTATATDLPEPPAKFSWHEVPTVRAAVLVPDGWHALEQRRGNTLSVFVTVDEFEPPQKFSIGLTAKVYLENKAAPSRIKRLTERACVDHGQTPSEGSSGPFVTISCQYDEKGKGGRESVRIFTLGIANVDTRTSYLITFTSPASKWEASWKLGKPIVDTLVLDTEF